MVAAIDCALAGRDRCGDSLALPSGLQIDSVRGLPSSPEVGTRVGAAVEPCKLPSAALSAAWLTSLLVEDRPVVLSGGLAAELVFAGRPMG
jgi:hypothetical protein